MLCRLLLCCALGFWVTSGSQAQDGAEATSGEPEGVAPLSTDAADAAVSAEPEPELEAEPSELPVIYAAPPSEAATPAIEEPAPRAEDEATEATNEAVTNEAVTNEAVTSEAVTSEAVMNEAVMNEPSEAPRLVLATTLGGLAGLVGGFGLSWGPSFIAAGTNEGSDDARIGAYFMGVTTWGTPLTTAVGIFAAGRAAGGRGNFGLTLLGTTLGGILGGGFAGIAYGVEHSQGLTIAGVLSIPVFQWAGGVLAYHLSHRARNRPRTTEPRREALPSLSIRPGGATLGWTGAF